MRIPATLVRKPVIKKSWYDKNDPQCHFVYLMERDFIGWTVETRHDKEFLESVVKHACRKRKIAPPILRVSSKPNDHVYGRCSDEDIWLNSSPDRPGNNLATLVHELAHWITDKTYGDHLPAHGKEFVYEYGQLLSDYKLFPFECYKYLCEKHGVEIYEPV